MPKITLKKALYYILFSVVILLTSIGLLVIFQLNKSSFLNPSGLVQTSDNAYQTDFTPIPTQAIQADLIKDSYKFKNVIGWIASFDYQRGKESFYKNISKYTEISPVYYDLNKDGTTSARSVAGDKDLLNISHKNKVKVTPTIISFDENSIQAMVNDEQKFSDHTNFLLNEINKYGYDGIDIDYESINHTDKDKYFDMLKDLSDKLHTKGKILSVSVVPKTADSGYNSLIETREVQDWTEIAKYADEVRIMAYDYSSADTVGPVSPRWWIDNILKYAKTKMPVEKTILGQPFYAYAYGTKRYAYTYDEIVEILNAQKLNPEFDDFASEKILKFKKGDEERTMYYQDNETFIKRYASIDKYGTGGISFWRLGGEDAKIYEKLEKQR